MIMNDFTPNGFVSFIPMNYTATTGLGSNHSSVTISYTANTYSYTALTENNFTTVGSMAFVP